MKMAFLVAVTDLLPVCLAYTSAGVCERHSGSTLCPRGELFSYWMETGVWCVEYSICGASVRSSTTASFLTRRTELDGFFFFCDGLF